MADAPQSAAGAPPRSRRTWPQRILIGFNLVLIVACLSGAGGIAYLYQRLSELPRITFDDGVLAPQPDEPGEPQNYLLVGSDDRANLDDAEAFGTAEEVGEAKSDTIMLVRIDPRSETADMVSFPRDLYVPIAGTDRSGRINTAFNEAGPAGAQRLIDTIKENFNIPVHHYAQVDFEGFRRVVDAVGGVNVFFPYEVRDRDSQTGRNLSGLDISSTGCIELTGDQALSYVRSRNFQELVDGEWEYDRTGDLGRIRRQQDFVRRALRKALTEQLLNPLRLNRLIDVANDTVKIDDALGVDDIVELGERFRSSRPEALQQHTLLVEPYTEPSSGAAYVRFIEENEADNEAIFDVFRGQEANGDRPLENPTAVSVQVLNGTGAPGEAGSASDGLEAAGFVVGALQDDPDQGVVNTTLVYASGREAKAELLARYLVGPSVLEESPDQDVVDVALVTGEDYEGIRSEPAPAEPEDPADTTTTAPSSTTTKIDTRTESERVRDYYQAAGRSECQ
ncbi:hypothetical protein BH18ACT1_BH18ACT1_16530 [soil metagenome]